MEHCNFTILHCSSPYCISIWVDKSGWHCSRSAPCAELMTKSVVLDNSTRRKAWYTWQKFISQKIRQRPWNAVISPYYIAKHAHYTTIWADKTGWHRARNWRRRAPYATRDLHCVTVAKAHGRRAAQGRSVRSGIAPRSACRVETRSASRRASCPPYGRLVRPACKCAYLPM